MLWEDKHELRANAVTFDPLLASASLTDRLRGQALSVTWSAVRGVERRVNENGYLLLETREGTSQSRWGREVYSQPRNDQVLSLVFRRVSAA